MTDPQVAIFMLSLFIFLVLLGFPIAFTLVAMGVGFGYYAYFQVDNLLNNRIFYLLNQNTYSVMENDVLVAIPLFLFMGYVVERANIVNRLFFSLQLATAPSSRINGCCSFSNLCNICHCKWNYWSCSNTNGITCFSCNGKSWLSQRFCLWRYLCRRNFRYFNSTKYYAYCLCGDSRIVSIKAVCCSNNSWIYVSWFLYDLCYYICIL